MENLLNAPRKPVISREFNPAHLESISKELFPPHDPNSVAGLLALSNEGSTPSTPPSSAPATSPPAINSNPSYHASVRYPDVDDVVMKLEF